MTPCLSTAAPVLCQIFVRASRRGPGASGVVQKRLERSSRSAHWGVPECSEPPPGTTRCPEGIPGRVFLVFFWTLNTKFWNCWKTLCCGAPGGRLGSKNWYKSNGPNGWFSRSNRWVLVGKLTITFLQIFRLEDTEKIYKKHEIQIMWWKWGWNKLFGLRYGLRKYDFVSFTKGRC